MTDPRRLIDGGADAFEAKLLVAGRSDTITKKSRRRVLLGLGVAGFLPGSALAATTAQGSSKGAVLLTGLSGTAKWIGGGIAGSVALWAGAQTFTDDAPMQLPPPEPPRLAAPATPEPATVQAAEPSEETEPPQTEAAEPPSKAPPALPKEAEAPTKEAEAPKPAKASLTEELEHIEKARRALRGGDAALSLRLLNEHSRKFQKPLLSTEAKVLRIEALTASGQSSKAAGLGKQFLAKHPNGPYAKRVKSLIGEARHPEPER